MKHTILNQAFAAAMITLIIALATLPGTASADDDPWKFRFAVVSMNPKGGTFVVSETDETFSYQSGSGVGLALDFEYRASRRLGIDFGVISASPGFTVAVDAEPAERQREQRYQDHSDLRRAQHPSDTRQSLRSLYWTPLGLRYLRPFRARRRSGSARGVQRRGRLWIRRRPGSRHRARKRPMVARHSRQIP